jgi:RNase P subunit RPR2
MSDPIKTLRTFADLPLKTRLRRTCTGCGQPFISDVAEALAFVTGPSDQPVTCYECGWVGIK